MEEQTLAIELRSQRPRFAKTDDISLSAVYTNVSQEPFTLTFWWNRRLEVVDSRGQAVAPGPGPVVPCGVNEEATLLLPGKSVERAEPFACTQPAGPKQTIGWSYALRAGAYRVTLELAFPPAHGFKQAAFDPRAWRGSVRSNTIDIVVGR
ncbi:hypothetical protein HY251_22105 [bacterium]|nr:hypothetical protein [bacterium]